MDKQDYTTSPPIDPNTPGAPIVNTTSGGHVEGDDINVPFVAILITTCAILLVILVLGLEAWFFHQDNAERTAKSVPQGAPGSPLGILLEEQTAELHTPGPNPRLSTKEATVHRIDINSAIDDTVTRYNTLNTPAAPR